MIEIKNRWTGKIMFGGASLEVVLERHKKWLHSEEGGERAVLTRADLTDADLTDADLTDAVLTDAVLTRAVLTRADLTRADLTRADLTDAVLTDAVLRDVKHDIWAVCLYAIPEIPNLVEAIKTGRIEGSQYSGECRCLCGTLEGKGPALPIRDAGSAAERWFMGISKGDKPDNNQISKITLEWIEELQGLLNREPKL